MLILATEGFPLVDYNKLCELYRKKYLKWYDYINRYILDDCMKKAVWNIIKKCGDIMFQDDTGKGLDKSSCVYPPVNVFLSLKILKRESLLGLTNIINNLKDSDMKIFNTIAKYREEGILMTDLSSIVEIDNKKVHHIISRLEELNLVYKVLLRPSSSSTTNINRVWLKVFKSSNNV